ncbi:hypothetical protein R3P38DRAFT_2785859 [Favolaschia claudopus]|uniref:Uncharacterized protein n=1 Tax=Favolaschia claudopus TaxID=2862362 RepID=A0AAW0AVP0_9AGAR
MPPRTSNRASKPTKKSQYTPASPKRQRKKNKSSPRKRAPKKKTPNKKSTPAKAAPSSDTLVPPTASTAASDDPTNTDDEFPNNLAKTVPTKRSARERTAQEEGDGENAGEEGDDEDSNEEEEDSDDEEEDDDDEEEEEEAPPKKRPKVKATANPATDIDITVTVTVYSRKEYSKKANKRAAEGSAVLMIASSLPYGTFAASLVDKVTQIAKLSSTPSYQDLECHFQVPRHVSTFVRLFNATDYTTMIANGAKGKDPKINFHVVLQSDDDSNEVESEPDKPKKKSKIPSEKGISAANTEINNKIGRLRAKWTCNVNDGSDYCWISGETRQHIPLHNPHFESWAAAWAQGSADLLTPPDLDIFRAKDGEVAPRTLLQRRLAAKEPVSNAPVINFNIPDALVGLMSGRQNPPAAGAPAPPTTAMLLPPNTQVGPSSSILDFCAVYGLSADISTKLTTNGYQDTDVFYLVSIDDLKEMQFMLGQIAQLREAVRKWAVAI